MISYKLYWSDKQFKNVVKITKHLKVNGRRLTTAKILNALHNMFENK